MSLRCVAESGGRNAVPVAIGETPGTADGTSQNHYPATGRRTDQVQYRFVI